MILTLKESDLPNRLAQTKPAALPDVAPDGTIHLTICIACKLDVDGVPNAFVN